MTTKIKMSDKMEMVPLKDIRPYKRNPRNNTEAIPKVAESILKFGFRNPIILDKENVVIAGHTRLLAAKKLGLKEVPCIWANDLTPDEVKALRLVDNKTAEYAEWELDLLSEELNDINLDLSAFDFDIDMATDDSEPIEVQEDDFDEETETNEHGVKQGDIWQLGRHRLMCGDATRGGDVLQLTNKEDIDMTFTDPPYGINVVSDEGHVGAKNVCEVGAYSKVINDDTTETAEKAYKILKDITPRQIIWGGNYFTDFLDHSDGWVVWDKRGDITSNNFADGEMAWCSFHTPLRIVKQIWMGMVKEGEHDKRVHPTQKPVRMLSDILQMFTDDDNKIIDVFGGSGSTLIACEQTNRQCYMMELDPHYCDVIISRWEKLTGQQAVKIA